MYHVTHYPYYTNCTNYYTLIVVNWRWLTCTRCSVCLCCYNLNTLYEQHLLWDLFSDLYVLFLLNCTYMGVCFCRIFLWHICVTYTALCSLRLRAVWDPFFDQPSTLRSQRPVLFSFVCFCSISFIISPEELTVFNETSRELILLCWQSKQPTKSSSSKQVLLLLRETFF